MMNSILNHSSCPSVVNVGSILLLSILLLQLHSVRMVWVQTMYTLSRTHLFMCNAPILEIFCMTILEMSIFNYVYC